MNKIIISMVALLLAPLAQAENKQFLGGGSYAQMCVNAVSIPAQFGGESDLKGNPKLGEYCECFSKAFTARAMKAITARQAGQQPPPLEQQLNEEYAMKNTCRKQFGLPLAIRPK